MSSLHTLRESRASKVAEMRGLTEAAQAANRDLDEGERRRFDALETEVRGLTSRITDAEKLAEFERFEATAEHVSGAGATRELRSYSLSKAISESMNGRLTGQEAEWHQELSRGREARGVMIPIEVLMEHRALTTTTPVAGPGGNLVGRQVGTITDHRRPALVTEWLGATVLRGLTGNLDLPRLTESGTASWVAEHAPATRSDAKFGKVSMGPKTVAAEYEVSRRMLLQSSQALEPILRNDLSLLLREKLDAAAIRGGGVNEPVGILANPSVPTITGGPISIEITADMIGAMEMANVDGVNGFLTHPKVVGEARKIKDGEMPLGAGLVFHDAPVAISTQIPTDLGVGDDKSALIYGAWSNLYIGYWSGVDILVNPYHADVASKGGALLHAFLDADVVVRHPEGFVWSEIG